MAEGGPGGCASRRLCISVVRVLRVSVGLGVWAYVRVRFAVCLVRLPAGTVHGGGPRSQGPGMSGPPRVETVEADTELALGDVWRKGQF